MARVSRKKGKTVPARQEAAIFPTAIYVRLSVEDNGKMESESLENQRELLEQYVKANPELKLADVYEDNGFTRHGLFPAPPSSGCWRTHKRGKSPASW